MSTLHIDRVTTLEMTERPGDATGGQIVELVREARITGIQDPAGPGTNPHTDYQVLQTALDDLNLALGSSAAGHDNLILVERTPRLVPGQLDIVDVHLRYEQRGRTLDSIQTGEFILEGSTGLKQVTSQRDRNGNDLNVSYTYPMQVGPPAPKDPCVAGYPLDRSLEGCTISQVGEIGVGMPQHTIQLIGRLQAQDPDFESSFRVGHINSDPWRNGDSGTWLCVSAEFNLHVLSQVSNQRIYEFRFTLQFDSLGHDPDVWYRDPRTGRMPIGLVEGIGIYEVPWYDSIDFDVWFPVIQ